MAAEVQFDDAEVREFLEHISSRTKQVKERRGKYVTLLSAIVFRDVLSHFEKEQGADGRWHPWSEIYKTHMEKIGRAGNKILQFNGRMRQSFTPRNYRTNASGILWFNAAQTKSGFPYAAAHDEGGGRLPKREFMWLSDKAGDKISEQTLQFIVEEGL